MFLPLLKKHASKSLPVVLLTLFFSLFYLSKINLVTADLGRHLKNGEVFFTEHKIISTNFYSYTETDFPAINHHWGTGVLFFLAWKLCDFSGLSVFYALLSGLALVIFLKIAQAKSDFTTALFVTALSLPLVTQRLEIRPEGFSFLLLGIYFMLLIKFQKREVSYKAFLLLLSALQVIWVNLHIFFILGIFLTGVFFVSALVVKKDFILSKQLGAALLALTLVSLLNPFGIKGLLAPLTIFKEYGYMVAENQSVLFMQKRFPSFMYLQYELFLLFTLIFIVYLAQEKKLKENFEYVAVAVVFGILGFINMRSMQMFSLFFIPLASTVIYKGKELLGGESPGSTAKNLLLTTGILTAFLILYLKVITMLPTEEGSIRKWGTGLLPGVQASAEFFRSHAVEGPVFNNYDIGGYLIFQSYPSEKVFVDNRPEAYSVAFFRDVYVPMQESEEKWREVDEQHGFNAIYFYRRDATPWAQPFLIRRLEDPEWAPVFVDDYVLILLRRNDKNAGIIEDFELPREIFVVI